MTWTHIRIPATRCARVVHRSFAQKHRGRGATPQGKGAGDPKEGAGRDLQEKARGRPGARCTRSPACSVKSIRVSHHRFTGTTSGLPCAVVLTAYSALSPATGLSCHCHPRDAKRVFTSLTPASGHQDHTASPYADRHPSSLDAVASTASRPNVRDDGQRPSQRGGTAGDKEVIWGKREGECFSGKGWTGSIALDWLGKLGRVRRRSDTHQQQLLTLTGLERAAVTRGA
jgi:hypothetical protein